MSAERKTSAHKLDVVFCWHMHQPEYRDPATGEYQLPWTYLHAIKDYVDMAAHLEAQPEGCAVVNFAPTLVEQLVDYAAAIAAWQAGSGRLPDPLLAALAGPDLPTDVTARQALVRSCLRANHKRLIAPFPPFARLAELAEKARAEPWLASYLNDAFLADLLVWYHLAWLGETVRRTDARAKRLLERAAGFSLEDRRELTGLIGELIAGIVPRYRRLAAEKRIELSLSPWAHPIVPLLLDFTSAREAMPEVALPDAAVYPGGEARARWHLEEGLRVFEEHFGVRPVGLWPSEGSVSEAALRLFGDTGFRWVASGQQVLENSLAAPGAATTLAGQRHCRPWHLAGGKTACFFRDDGLSDLIGFTYTEWHADDAVANLVEHLVRIASDPQCPPGSVVSIVLDGENAWEYYPANGYYFLGTLYKRLAQRKELRLTTFSGHLDRRKAPQGELTRLVAGSWVYGTFSTWMGDADKNRAWDHLVSARKAFDERVAAGALTGEALARAERQLAVCEGSDWFWWFGDYNPAESVRLFDGLYRRHLVRLYELIGVAAPEALAQPFSHGGGAALHGGVMRTSSGGAHG